MPIRGPSEERITTEMESMLGDAKNSSNSISAENGKPDTIPVLRKTLLDAPFIRGGGSHEDVLGVYLGIIDEIDRFE